MLFMLPGLFAQDASGSVDEVQALQPDPAPAFSSSFIQSQWSFQHLPVTHAMFIPASSHIPGYSFLTHISGHQHMLFPLPGMTLPKPSMFEVDLNFSPVQTDPQLSPQTTRQS